MSQRCIISLGSINVDMQVRVPRWPDAGGLSVASDFLMAGGGKAANVAYLARLLGVRSQLVARLGDDDLAEHALAPLRAQGVDLSAARKVPGQATGVALIAVQPDGDKTILLAGNANDVWVDEDEVQVAALMADAPPGSVLVADYEVPAHIVHGAVRAARERGLAVIVDPSPPARVAAALYPDMDYVVPDHREAEQLTGVAVRDLDSALAAADGLVAQGAGAALVKLPDGGCAVVGPDTREHVPSGHPEPVDKTGAGDAFAGGLGVAVLEGRGLVEAARVAVACADVAVTAYGSQAAYPARAELAHLLE